MFRIFVLIKFECWSVICVEPEFSGTAQQIGLQNIKTLLCIHSGSMDTKSFTPFLDIQPNTKTESFSKETVEIMFLLTNGCCSPNALIRARPGSE